MTRQMNNNNALILTRILLLFVISILNNDDDVLLIFVSGDVGRTFVNFQSNKAAKDTSNLKDLHYISRIQLPYGPDMYGDHPTQTATDKPYNGYSFGVAAAEVWTYDTKHHYVYAATQLSYVNVVDYSNPKEPKIIEQFYAGEGEIRHMVTCDDKGLLFLVYQDIEQVGVFSTVQRNNPKTPILLKQFSGGPVPTHILPNSQCSLLITANENEGKDLSLGGITVIRDIDNLIRSKDDDDSYKPNITSITANNDNWNDDYFLRKGLNMPLTYNAIHYWDNISPLADEIDLSELRNNYSPAIMLRPSVVVWSSSEENEVLLNLQVNNGFLRINIETNQVVSAVGYGLKDHNMIPIDLKDGDEVCDLRRYPIYSLRNPDSINAFQYNDKTYLLTANEGKVGKYDDWRESWKAYDIFVGNTSGLPGMKFHPSIFDTDNYISGESSLFNSACIGQDCVGEVKISVGSNAVDYELDPSSPEFYRMVLFGGRGWSIFEIPDDPDVLLKLVFDSADDAERLSCETFPWAYNSVMNEEYAPTADMPNNTLWHLLDEEDREALVEINDPEQDGCEDQGDGTPGSCPMSKTVDRASLDGGPQFETAHVGIACGRLVAIAETENNSLLWIYDITNLASPSVFKVIHLSPSTKDKSAKLSYNDGTIGEIDPETLYFLSARESPTGKAAIAVGGAYSGTISFWEFECGEEGEIDFSEGVGVTTSSAARGRSTILITYVTATVLSLVLLIWNK